MEIFGYTFFQNALLGVTIVSVAAAIIGTYVVVRRMVAITGGITHASFGGLGFGFWAGCDPSLTALAAAVASALGIEWLSARGTVREDSAIGVVWALGMAVGTLFIFLTPGYVPELTTFLFGNLLTITRLDILVAAAFLLILVAVFLLGHDIIVACAFDRDWAATRRLPVTAVNTLMTVLTAVTVVLTARLIGIMLLMSLLTLPQLTAERLVRRLRPMMVISAVISLICALAGLFISYLAGTPASATIVIALIIVYAASRLLPARLRH